jgi:hypothetical protein
MNSAEDKRPYAAAANVLGTLRRCRTRNLPDKVDNDFIRLAGVPEVVLSRVASTFRFLGFTDDDDQPTDTLRALAAAPEEQYREILAGAIRNAYETDFARIDPAHDTQKQIIDAFRPYQPRSQTSRMVMLFLALCREAGIEVMEAPRERAMGSATPRPATSRSAKQQDTAVGRRPKQDQQRRRGEVDGVASPTPLPANLLFTVTDEDVSVLSDDEFASVWAALGKVARARALARSSPGSTDSADSAESASDHEDGDS